MKVKGIGVNIADMMPAVRNIQENESGIQSADDLFGPEYEVTISEEGRRLIEGQTAQGKPEEQEAQGVRGVEDDEELEMMLSSLRETQLAASIRYGYEDELDEIEKQIKVMNAAYGGMKDSKAYHDPLMKELAEQQRLLQEEMQKQKDLQAEEAQRRLQEAQRAAAVQTSQYQEEIDENNRDLVTLLKTMKETKKAGDEQENNGSKDGSDVSSDKEGSTSDAIRNSAEGFMRSSLNREKDVEELSGMIGDAGRGYLSQADAIAQNLLKKGAFIRAAIDDESFTNGQIDEMMKDYRREVGAKSGEAYILGSFGTQVLRDTRDVRLRRIKDDPLRSMQETKNGMMQAAADAAFAEARQSSIDKTSGELAEEMQRLIDERDGIDRIPEDKEEDGEQTLENSI